MIGTNSTAKPTSDDEYERFLAALRAQVKEVDEALFTTDAADLYAAFLAALPPESRQEYECAECRRFVERYGRLATITPNGTLRALLWSPATTPALFRASVEELARRVEGGRITGVFYSPAAVWGRAENVSARTGQIWRHMSVVPNEAQVFRERPLATATRAAAEKREEYAMLERGLADYPLDVAIRADALLKSGNLYRSEKAEAIARWLVELHERRAKARTNAARANLTWLAVANAPTGFAQLRAGMLGTLLDDVQSGLPFDAIASKWAAKMDPLQYMRPQAAPSAANIAQAEKIVAALKSAGALERRFARLEDVRTLWKAAESTHRKSSNGVFAQVAAKDRTRRSNRVEQPAVTMTFEKFRRDVLPTAAAIDAWVAERANFVALLTAVHPDAPPIVQWDVESDRNPVSWYVYPNGSPTQQWGLSPGWVAVTAIALLPPMWNPARDHGQHGKGAFVLLEGCRDSLDSGIALFPEFLKSEYRPIRATLEAFSRSAKLQGREQASACGIDLRAGREWTQKVRVTDRRGVATHYVLDRWD